MASTAPNITIELAAPIPSLPLVKAKEYIKVAGTSDEYPGPPPVKATTRSKLFMAIWDRIITVLKKTGLRLGMIILVYILGRLAPSIWAALIMESSIKINQY